MFKQRFNQILINFFLGFLSIVFAVLFYVYFSAYTSLNNNLKATGDSQYGGHYVRLISQPALREEKKLMIDQTYVTHKSHQLVEDVMFYANQVNCESQNLFEFGVSPTMGKYILKINGVGFSNLNSRFYWKILSPTLNNLMSYQEFEPQNDYSSYSDVWTINSGISFLSIIQDTVLIFYQT